MAAIPNKAALERRCRFLAKRHAPDAEFPYERMNVDELTWLEKFLELEGGGDAARNHSRYAAANDALNRVVTDCTPTLERGGHSINPEFMMNLAQRLELDSVAEEKTCRACGEARPLADFHRFGRGDARRPVCRFCVCVRSA